VRVGARCALQLETLTCDSKIGTELVSTTRYARTYTTEMPPEPVRAEPATTSKQRKRTPSKRRVRS
jgi:hypothetical protein